LQRVIDFNSSFGVDPLGVSRFNGYGNQPGGISRGIESYVEAAPWRGGDRRASYTYTNSDRFLPTKVDLLGSYERRVSERITITLFGGADNLFDARYLENGFARRESWRGAEFTYSSDDGSVLEKSRK